MNNDTYLIVTAAEIELIRAQAKDGDPLADEEQRQLTAKHAQLLQQKSDFDKAPLIEFSWTDDKLWAVIIANLWIT